MKRFICFLSLVFILINLTGFNYSVPPTSEKTILSDEDNNPKTVIYSFDPRGSWTVKFYDPYDQSYWSEQQIELTGGLTSGTVTWIGETYCSPTDSWSLAYPEIFIFNGNYVFLVQLQRVKNAYYKPKTITWYKMSD